MAFVEQLFRIRIAVLALLVLASVAAFWLAFRSQEVPVGALFLTALSLVIAAAISFIHLRHAGLAIVQALAPLPGLAAAGPFAVDSGLTLSGFLAIYGFALVAGSCLSGDMVCRVLQGSDQIAGALGREVLRRFRVTLDYPSKTLTLDRADGPPLQGVSFDQANSILLDGRVGDRFVGKFVLDTSSYTPGAMDLLFVSREMGLTVFSEGVKRIDEGAYFFKFTMPGLEVGGTEFTKFPATGVDLRQLQHQIGINVRGVVGQSLLRSCRLEIDLKNQKLLLRRIEAPAEPAKHAVEAPKGSMGAK